MNVPLRRSIRNASAELVKLSDGVSKKCGTALERIKSSPQFFLKLPLFLTCYAPPKDFVWLLGNFANLLRVHKS